MRLMITVLLLASLLPAQQVGRGEFDQDQWNRAVGLGGQEAMFSLRRSNRESTPCELAAIKAGLRWLQQQQRKDGSWPCEHNMDARVAMTSLCALAMLGDGNTMRVGPHRESLKKAVGWLRVRQKKNGAFASATGPHLLATLAMTESLHLSDYKLLKKSAAEGVAHAATLRSTDGGWRATPNRDTSAPSLTLWGTTLLATAAAADLIPKDNACEGVLDWLRSTQATLAPESGILGKEVPMVRQAELAHDQAAANAFTLCWLAIDNRDPAVRAAMQADADAMRNNALTRARSHSRIWEQNPKHRLSINEWFCSAHALAQAGDQKSVAAICKSLAKAQVADGEDRGSWAPIGVWGDGGGRVWTTAMAVLTLEAPFRYAKITGR